MWDDTFLTECAAEVAEAGFPFSRDGNERVSFAAFRLPVNQGIGPIVGSRNTITTHTVVLAVAHS